MSSIPMNAMLLACVQSGLPEATLGPLRGPLERLLTEVYPDSFPDSLRVAKGCLKSDEWRGSPTMPTYKALGCSARANFKGYGMSDKYVVDVEILKWLLNKAVEGFPKGVKGLTCVISYADAVNDENLSALTLCVRYKPTPAVLILTGKVEHADATLRSLLYGDLAEAMRIGRERKVTTYLCAEPAWNSQFVHMTGEERPAIHRAVTDSNLPEFIKGQFNGTN